MNTHGITHPILGNLFAGAPYWFYPDYAMLGISALYPGTNGALLALSTFGVRTPEALRCGPGFWLPFGVTAGILRIGLAGLSGDLYPFPNPLDSQFERLTESILGEMSP